MPEGGDMNKREILFRGKRIDNGEWVEGYYTYTASGSHGFLPSIIVFNGGSTIPYFVDPSTIGQYIRKPDKNGKKIFEGDICKFTYFKNEYIGRVVYNNFTCSFEMWFQTTVGAFGEKATRKMIISHCENIEVIGNIYDKESEDI